MAVSSLVVPAAVIAACLAETRQAWRRGEPAIVEAHRVNFAHTDPRIVATGLAALQDYLDGVSAMDPAPVYLCDSEIAPVVYSNLRSPAGVWDGFDEHWLIEQILAQMNKPNRWQDALLDPIRRIFTQTNHLSESQWPLLILKYREIKRAQHMIEL